MAESIRVPATEHGDYVLYLQWLIMRSVGIAVRARLADLGCATTGAPDSPPDSSRAPRTGIPSAKGDAIDNWQLTARQVLRLAAGSRKGLASLAAAGHVSVPELSRHF